MDMEGGLAVFPRCKSRLPVRVVGPLAMVALTGLLLPACGWDGHFTLLGYSTRPNYDLGIHTVRVPVFKNRTYWVTTPAPGMEMDLTKAVVREIELRTPYKVVQCDADTELKGTIVGFTKTPINYNALNYGREMQCTLIVELWWRDLRTGELLSQPARRPGAPIPQEPRGPILALPDPVTPRRGTIIPNAPEPQGDNAQAVIEDPDAIEAAERKKQEVPTVVRSIAYFRPELGESLTTALQTNINLMAVQIVSAMEKGW
jgi:hypothetical protein